LALGAAALPATAAPTPFSFSATVTAGSVAGETGTGFFAFDPDLFTGVGQELVTVADGLQIGFNFLGGLFTERNDLDYADYPLVILQDGVPVYIDYLVAAGASGASFPGYPQVAGFALRGELVAGQTLRFTVPVEVYEGAPLPEPATLVLLGAALLAASAARRRGP
jgi:hypothetical protein